MCAEQEQIEADKNVFDMIKDLEKVVKELEQRIIALEDVAHTPYSDEL